MTHIKVDGHRILQQANEQQETLARSLTSAAQAFAEHLPTPHRVVLRSGSLQLLKFEPSIEPALKTPLLICYALVNRPWILDLSQQRSMIRSLLDQGIPVYLIDWGYPSRCDCHLTLDDYLCELLDRCVDKICSETGSENVNLMGVCQGGVFSLCYSLLFPHKVRNLITLATPVDTSVETFSLNHLTRVIDVELATQTYGNLPGELLNELFTALQPLRLGLKKQMAASHQLCADAASVQHYLLMEQWLQDCPDLAGEALKEFIELFFRDNALMSKQGFELAGSTIRLAELSQPVLNIYGSRDQLVPPEASSALKRVLSTKDYTEVSLDAGHIGVLNGSRALTTLPPQILDWLQQREPK